jgi:hypothetical protein
MFLLPLLLAACAGSADEDGDGTPARDDCADDDKSRHPGAEEACDGLDSDCDGLADDADPDAPRQEWYPDLDGDGYGRASGVKTVCEANRGWVQDATDCDDARAAVYPGAPEQCDGLDHDCDGLIGTDDPDLSTVTWYLDADADGYGDPATGEPGCAAPDEHVADGTDCDDADPEISPGTTDVCGGGDADCDGWDDACEREDTFDLAEADARILGRAAGDAAGGALALADADGDGVADLLVLAAGQGPDGTASLLSGPLVAGATLADAGATFTGASWSDLWLLDLDGDGLASPVLSDGAALYVFSGNGDLDIADASASIVGGVRPTDAATLGDTLLVGDPGAQDTDGSAAGAVYGLSTLAVGWSLTGTTGSAAGTSLAAADLDGDGVTDLVVGGPSDDTAADGAGAAWFVSAASGGGSLLDADATLLGVAADDGAGSRVAAVGDIDGDGLGDLMIGAPGADDPADTVGAAYLVLAPVSSGSLSEARCTLLGEEVGDRAGTSIVAAGDVNGDERADVLLGSTAGDGDGRAWLLLGPFAGTISLSYAEVRLVGSELDEVGVAVAAGADADGDGAPDLFVGVPGADDAGSNAGAVALVRGW